MKELVNAITQASINRLRAPFLGSFILAWLAVNHVFVVEFLFSSSEDKVVLVKSNSLDFLRDAFYPLGLALLYTYGLPFIQHLIDGSKHRWIDRKRIADHHGRRADEYRLQMVASEYQAKSSLSYQQDKLNRDLDNWEQQREEYESRIENLNTQLESGTDQLTLITAELEKTKQEQQLNAEKVDYLTAENKKKKEDIDVLNKLSTQFERTKSKLKSVENNIETLQAELTSEKNNSTTLEDIVLEFNDSMDESDNNIKSDLYKDLTLRSGLNESDIDVVIDSYMKRVRQYRGVSLAHYGVVNNLKQKKEERENRSKFNSIIVEESEAEAMPQGISV
ncbi:hypothetical protein [Vibrio splendidus]|uniref:hypothetical protein n=1 Tax=Vibrio splendidus TaxID=29497 RepID=UPI000C868149|nr:hypothetical protein [Vibrio splendidus]PMK15881.1 hypothetical protein BCU10_13895 [Vibrio splendidus]